MKVKTLILGNIQTNCYVVSSDDKHCFIVDPGANGKKVLNYLNENELSRLNRLVTMFIDYAELMAEDEILMSMQDWVEQTN